MIRTKSSTKILVTIQLHRYSTTSNTACRIRLFHPRILYRKDINGQTIKELGYCFRYLLPRQMARSIQHPCRNANRFIPKKKTDTHTSTGSIVDMIAKPLPQTPVQSKRTKTGESRSSIDYDDW